MPTRPRVRAATLILAVTLSTPILQAKAGPVLYGADAATNQLIAIDPGTGAATAVGAFGSEGVVGMAYDATTDTLFGAGGRLLAIDRLSGAATPVGGLLNFSVSGLAAHPLTGQLYGVDSIANVLLEIDKASGTASVVGPLGGGDAFENVTGLAFDPTGQTLYGVENGNDQLVTIDPATGAATGIGSPFTVGGLVVTALAFHPEDGRLFGGDAAGRSISQLVEIEPTTGVGSAIGPTGFLLVEGLAFAPVVPEPSAAALLLLASAGLPPYSVRGRRASRHVPLQLGSR